MAKMALLGLRRKIHGLNRKLREVRLVAKALKEPTHPIVVHIVPIRRCNLSCNYCSEYDTSSPPVPIEEMDRRIDRLAALGTTAVTISGGEPLLHPDLDRIIQRIRSHGMLATLITNGYLLTVDRIRRLNRAGLDYLQISIDNARPDEVSMKSLKVLDLKLRYLAEHAEFSLTVNSVLGSSIKNPQDALQVTHRARELGSSSTVGIIHDHHGQLQPLNEEQKEVYDQILALPKRSFFNFSYYNQFQQNLVRGLPNQWHCRAGSRYLYICEDGLVHYCSQQRGHPGIPLADYTRADLERENKAVKSCAPYCTVSCVHQVAMIDHLREQPREAVARFFPPKPGDEAGSQLPRPIKMLTWLFLPANPESKRRIFRNAALRILRVK
ncbi:MAG TPA: radical SAM protein [Blastocatellia bacterium]|nr:radical SAM protein [Blastocatellia bacterium]